MREYKLPNYDLGKHSLDHAFNIVFSEDTLTETHGSSIKTTQWKDNMRTTDFYIQIEAIPWALRHIFCGSGLHVTVNQTMNKTLGLMKVKNEIQTHFIGSRLFKVASEFDLSSKGDHIFLSGKVSCIARLPLPLNMIAERFMINQCKKEITSYTEVVGKKFISESCSKN